MTIKTGIKSRYHRQICLPNIGLNGQDAIEQAKVVVVGVGGLGNSVAQQLVSAGLGYLTLIDFDRVELSNLHRQVLFDEADVDRLKTQVAQEKLALSNSSCQIRIIDQAFGSVDSLEAIGLADVVVDCTDRLDVRNHIARECFKAKRPLVSGAAIRMEGQLFIQMPDKNTPCYQCYSQQFKQPSTSCVENGVLGPVVAVIGAMQALQALKIIVGMDVRANELQLWDAGVMSWSTLRLNRAQHCALCGQK